MFQAIFSLAWFPAPGSLAPSAAPAAVLFAGFSALALLLAFWADRRWGEPPARFHPVVWIGRYLQWAGSWTVRFKPAPAFALGALAWCAGAVLCGLLAWRLQSLVCAQLAWWAGPPSAGMAWLPRAGLLAALLAVTAALLKCMLSWRMLAGEVRAVEDALGESLQAGRVRLSWLVSRDTFTLGPGEVRESAIESLAENFNDSVVAPVFWFLLFGLPGAAIYRFANTADAMWGYPGIYRGKDWQWAGKWAARADDVLSWIPARLTAWLIAAAAGGVAWPRIRAEARKTLSPNSGWPMGAMALALGVRLCKPGAYALNEGGRSPEPSDTARAQQLCAAALRRLLAFALAVFAAAGLAMAAAPARAPAATVVTHCCPGKLEVEARLLLCHTCPPAS